VATRVGLNPRDFKNVKAVCAGIRAKVKTAPYRTGAHISKNQNNMMNQLKKAYANKQNSNVRRIEEMRRKIKENNEKRYGISSPKRLNGVPRKGIRAIVSTGARAKVKTVPYKATARILKKQNNMIEQFKREYAKKQNNNTRKGPETLRLFKAMGIQ